MKKKQQELKRYLLGVLGALLVIGGVVLAMMIFSRHIAFFSPAGVVASQQTKLFLFAVALMLIVIIPVFVMLFLFAWKYRESNVKSNYQPKWDSNNKLEAVWWGIPVTIILVLASVTWVTSHSLDPFKPIENGKAPFKVQVIALQWKWLFIYPDQKMASVNELHIPVDRPVEFTITSDAPMNSFWIPKLGSQIYAMSGMSTKLHLVASEPGVFEGVSANISGEGFADMKFSVIATSDSGLSSWQRSVSEMKAPRLDSLSYAGLAKKSIEKTPLFYTSVSDDLYNEVVKKYMPTTMNHEEMH